MGKTDIEDALRRLDQLTQEEVRMATVQLLTLTHGVDDLKCPLDVDKLKKKLWDWIDARVSHVSR